MTRVFRDAEREADAARGGVGIFGQDFVTRALVRYLSWLDMVAQLSRRLKSTREDKEGDVTAKKSGDSHVLIVAEDDEKAGEIVACIEMGVVNVPNLIAKGAMDELEQWGQSREELDKEKVREYVDAATLLDPRAETNVDLPYIGNLAVAQGWRRRGIGRRLVGAAERVAVEWGYPAVCLHVDADSFEATSLYARLGYECTAREPVWSQKVGRVRRLFLRKRLGDAGTAVDMLTWEEGVAEVGKKMTFLESLRYSFVSIGDPPRRRRN